MPAAVTDVAGQAIGRGAAHAGQIRIDPPVPGIGNDRLDRRLDLPMINTCTVQRNQRHTAAMLDVMDQYPIDPTLHTATVVIHADDMSCARNSRPRMRDQVQAASDVWV